MKKDNEMKDSSEVQIAAIRNFLSERHLHQELTLIRHAKTAEEASMILAGHAVGLLNILIGIWEKQDTTALDNQIRDMLPAVFYATKVWETDDVSFELADLKFPGKVKIYSDCTCPCKGSVTFAIKLLTDYLKHASTPRSFFEVIFREVCCRIKHTDDGIEAASLFGFLMRFADLSQAQEELKRFTDESFPTDRLLVLVMAMAGSGCKDLPYPLQSKILRIMLSSWTRSIPIDKARSLAPVLSRLNGLTDRMYKKIEYLISDMIQPDEADLLNALDDLRTKIRCIKHPVWKKFVSQNLRVVPTSNWESVIITLNFTSSLSQDDGNNIFDLIKPLAVTLAKFPIIHDVILRIENEKETNIEISISLDHPDRRQFVTVNT